jgi:hypothetical protein
VWPNWIDLQDICASSTASGVGAVSSKGLGSTSTTKSSQIDLNKELEVHDIDSDENSASPGGFTKKKSNTNEPEKISLLEVGQKKLQEGKNGQWMMP